MAKIVLVHGAFNELWGPHELKERWLPAVRDGLWHEGVTIDAADVDVCFYGDLFRRVPGAADESEFQASRAGIAEMLSKLPGGGPMEAIGQAASTAAFDRTVDMVTTMATQADLRDRIRDRFDAVVGDDTRIVVSHSLGTVITYNHLTRRSDLAANLVTLGSPLASDQISQVLDPPPVDGRGHWPGSTRRWTNVAALGDHAVGSGQLADRYGPGPDGQVVEDHRVDNGHRAHDPEPYLNSRVSGAAIARALRDT